MERFIQGHAMDRFGGISVQRGGRWDFRFCGFGHFLDRFFGFCTEKRRFFGFGVCCGLRFFLF